MTMLEQIKKEKQRIARCEKSLSLEKLKKRKADTRRKIELGGLVIKSGMANHNKFILLGGLKYLNNLIEQNSEYITIFSQVAKDMLI